MDECGYSMPVHAEKAVAVIDSAPATKEGAWEVARAAGAAADALLQPPARLNELRPAADRAWRCDRVS